MLKSGVLPAASPPDSAVPDLEVRNTLLEWYGRNRRDLPWRRKPDPYRVLVSEIMLQQTQVDRVIPYFEAFLDRFPTFAALASASRAEVITLWAGLGYNRRAVQLHELARCVVTHHGGELPRERRALLSLPGIGPYTAGAVLSIAFGADEPALDTNVRRVILRLAFDPARAEGRPSPPELEAAARRLVPPGRAGDWNQSLMDLGSAICLRRRPRCLMCPLRLRCPSAGRVAHGSASGLKPAATYTGTTRYYRGRLLNQLRSLPVSTMVPLAEVADGLAARGVAEPRVGWRTVAEALARDGLARVEQDEEDIRAGLP